jgi:hypothetical protein
MVTKTEKPAAAAAAKTTNRPTPRTPAALMIKLTSDGPSIEEQFRQPAMQLALIGGLAARTSNWKPGRHKFGVILDIAKPAVAPGGDTARAAPKKRA